MKPHSKQLRLCFGTAREVTQEKGIRRLVSFSGLFDLDMIPWLLVGIEKSDFFPGSVPEMSSYGNTDHTMVGYDGQRWYTIKHRHGIYYVAQRSRKMKEWSLYGIINRAAELYANGKATVFHVEQKGDAITLLYHDE